MITLIHKENGHDVEYTTTQQTMDMFMDQYVLSEKIMVGVSEQHLGYHQNGQLSIKRRKDNMKYVYVFLGIKNNTKVFRCVGEINKYKSSYDDLYKQFNKWIKK